MEGLDAQQQLQAFKQNDAYSQLLLFTESLVTKVTDLSTQLEEVTGDLEDQNANRRDWKRRAETAETMISKNPFVLVLVDGDGYIFHDQYLKNPESGGGDAAHRLLSEVRDCINAAQMNTLPPDSEIVVNIYANKRGLTGALLDAGTISTATDLEKFFCKFTQSQAHFQFVDCGPGKERVDAKVRETYRFFLQDCHCRLIILALCHDNGYIAELDKYRNDVTAREKTWLVDHYSKGRAFMYPPFPMIQFDHVFSTRPLSINRPTAPTSHTRSSYSSALAGPAMLGQAARPGHNPVSMAPPESRFGPDIQPSTITPHESPINSIRDHQTPCIVPGVEVPTSDDQIPVNRSDQRIDTPIRLPSIHEQHDFEKRIAYRKLCNEHYLRNYCLDRNCRFDHAPIDKGLENTLRYTARKIVCRSGAACRRADCYYGHQCPFANCDARRCPFAKAGLHDVRDLEIVRFVGTGS